MRKFIVALFLAALIAMGSVSVSWGNEAKSKEASPEGGTWEGIGDVLGGTWE